MNNTKAQEIDNAFNLVSQSCDVPIIMEIPKLYKLKFETEIVWEEQIEESYTTVTNVSAVVLNKDLTFMKHQIDAIVQENDIAFLGPDSVVMPEKMVREVDTKLFTLNLSFRKSICTTFE